jgi:uncharacterized protein YndB with AHSA1/START domain
MRTDRGCRVIRASAQKIYEAHLDPKAIAQWRPPHDMRAEVYAFDAREGGRYRMAFVYPGDNPAVRGKTTANADVFEGTFVELVPNERIVEVAEFTSDDPAFAGAMTVRTLLEPAAEGTEVSIVCEDVPVGISESDHQAGIASTLANLAAFVE